MSGRNCDNKPLRRKIRNAWAELEHRRSEQARLGIDVGKLTTQIESMDDEATVLKDKNTETEELLTKARLRFNEQAKQVEELQQQVADLKEGVLV